MVVLLSCVLEKVVGLSACLEWFQLLLAMVVGIVFLVHPHGIDSFLHYCFFFFAEPNHSACLFLVWFNASEAVTVVGWCNLAWFSLMSFHFHGWVFSSFSHLGRVRITTTDDALLFSYSVMMVWMRVV